MEEYVKMYNEINNEQTGALRDVVPDSKNKVLFISQKKFVFKNKSQCNQIYYPDVAKLKARKHVGIQWVIIFAALTFIAMICVSKIGKSRLEALDEIIDQKRVEYQKRQGEYIALQNSCSKNVEDVLSFVVEHEEELTRLRIAAENAQYKLWGAEYDYDYCKKVIRNINIVLPICCIIILLVISRRKLVIVDRRGNRYVTVKLGRKKKGVKERIEYEMNEAMAIQQRLFEEQVARYDRSLEQPLEGTLARYEVYCICGVPYNIDVNQDGVVGMNIMSDGFYFRKTASSKHWFNEFNLLYKFVTGIHCESNMVCITYMNANNKEYMLRIGMVSGVSLPRQIENCDKLLDIIRENNFVKIYSLNTSN